MNRRRKKSGEKAFQITFREEKTEKGPEGQWRHTRAGRESCGEIHSRSEEKSKETRDVLLEVRRKECRVDFREKKLRCSVSEP